MELLSQLAEPARWQTFYEYKVDGGHLSKKDLKELSDFVETKGYLDTVKKICRGGTFTPPHKACISKMHSGKKRIVYTYAPAENYVLKLLTFLLQRRYDYLFTDNLYSFRPKRGVKDAITTLTHTPGIGRMWSYKVDISNYFNSVPIERLLPLLRAVLADVPETCRFLESLLTNPLVEEQGRLVEEEKGIMAGTPVSTFLANLYLAHMDRWFSKAGILYARYSDDIIVFAENEEQLSEYICRIQTELTAARLTVNPEKEQRTGPGESWIFLGICYQKGVIDVSPLSVEKLKAKMRRKTRALMRWKARKGASGIHAAKAFIRAFRRKLFENPIEHELTWTRWYFPLINTARSLKIIDAYSQSCVRYLATGTHTKAAYNFRYDDMKAIGYVSLVNCYYKHQRAPEGEEQGRE